jgi:hypothetical protein
MTVMANQFVITHVSNADMDSCRRSTSIFKTVDTQQAALLMEWVWF